VWNEAIQSALTSWVNLNSAVIGADEATCQALLAAEKSGKARRMFMLRIHSRYNKLRADRERQELTSVAKTRG
jgi:hypothetical protein